MIIGECLARRDLRNESYAERRSEIKDEGIMSRFEKEAKQNQRYR